MRHYLIKQFLRNRAYLAALAILLVSGLIAIFTGSKFLKSQQDTVGRSAAFQKESIARNVKFHKKDLGLVLYYQKFNIANETPRLSGLNIGVRDINPVIKGVTIRNLEEQRHNADFFNPSGTASGNFDFIFVLIFLFPLVIIAMTFNLRSEEVESGTWKMLSVQGGRPLAFLDSKLMIRIAPVFIIYILLFFIAGLWLKIPLDGRSALYFFCGLLYLVFWAVFSRWVVSLKKSSAYNAVFLVGAWIFMNFLVPMTANIFLENAIPVNSSIEAFMRQRDGYHNKWDEKKRPTMEKFYAIYPQYRKYQVAEDDEFTWTWYYAMQHLGDAEAAPAAQNYKRQMEKRNLAAQYLGYLFPNIHTLLETGRAAESDLQNQLDFDEALQKFHERKRLEFYDAIFSNKLPTELGWSRQNVEFYRTAEKNSALIAVLPYLIFIALFFILSQKNLKSND